MLTDEQIIEVAGTQCAVPGSYAHALARAIESAACAPLLERIAALEAECDRLERYWNEALATHENIEALKSRIAELEADRDQVRGLFNKSKDEFHTARQESSLRWQMICDLTNQRDALEAKLAQRVPDENAAFEAEFKMPSSVVRCGDGYAATEYGAWQAHSFIESWRGWKARSLLAAAPAAPEQQEPECSCPKEGFCGAGSRCVDAQTSNAQQTQPERVTKEMWRALAETQASLLEIQTRREETERRLGLDAQQAEAQPVIRDAVKRSCPLCEESWYEFAEGTVAQAPNAQQAEPSCESQTDDSESQPSLSARGSQQEVVEAQPVAWSTFDGEGGHDYRSYDGNETYREEYERRNPRHKNWVQPLYTAQPKAVPLTPDELADKCEAYLQSSISNVVDAYEAGYRDCEAAHGIDAPAEKGVQT